MIPCGAAVRDRVDVIFLIDYRPNMMTINCRALSLVMYYLPLLGTL